MKSVSWLLLFLVAIAGFAPSGDVGGVYHKAAPGAGAKLLPILPAEQLWGEYGQPHQKRAYALAQKYSGVIYQLPCQCHCERQGHTSLRSCFESLHGTGCYVCMKEVFYAAAQTRLGKTPARIRQGITRSEHDRMDLQYGALP